MDGPSSLKKSHSRSLRFVIQIQIRSETKDYMASMAVELECSHTNIAIYWKLHLKSVVDAVRS